MSQFSNLNPHASFVKRQIYHQAQMEIIEISSSSMEQGEGYKTPQSHKERDFQMLDECEQTDKMLVNLKQHTDKNVQSCQSQTQRKELKLESAILNFTIFQEQSQNNQPRKLQHCASICEQTIQGLEPQLQKISKNNQADKEYLILKYKKVPNGDLMFLVEITNKVSEDKYRTSRKWISRRELRYYAPQQYISYLERRMIL